MPTDERFSIWLLQCGVMHRFPRSGLFQGAHNEGTLEVPLGYVVVEDAEHRVVIDTGYKFLDYGRELAELYGVENWRTPDELLGELGMSPADIDTLIVTHAHWDHMGYLEAFPDATIWLQRSELAGWLDAFSLPAQFAFLKGGVDPADFHHLLERTISGQVRLVDGIVRDVIPGIDLHPALDTHTAGCQFAVIHGQGRDRPAWVAVGDVVFQYRNLEGDNGSGEYVPIGQASGSLTNVLRTFDEIMGHVKGDAARIVPVHDLTVYERYPSRQTLGGLRLAEIALRSGSMSRVAVTSTA